MDSAENQTEVKTGKFALPKRLRWALILVVVVAAVGAGGFALMRRASGRLSGSNPEMTTFIVRRDDLTIGVTENGDIKAINTKDIKSKVEGKTTIISIVDEGTIITPNDVNTGRVLVELDSSDIEQKLTQQEVQFLSAEASFIDANESLDIQKKQNESDIKKGLMEVRFKLMDLQKYFGEVVAEKLVSGKTNPGYEPNQIPSLIEDTQLGGEALQKLRELEVDIDLKDMELKEADSKLTWTRKLYEKEYVSRTDLEADILSQKRNEIALKKARTAKNLFIEYEFPKEAEKRLSDYDEAKRELDRTQARARSKLAQAHAKLKSSQATYLLHKERLEKLKEQLEACTMKAPAAGQVVYGSSEEPWYRRQDRMIEEGADVWERQKIISIPDQSEMKVEIKVHETWIDKVKIGQAADITVAAFPDKTFTGKVLKKAPLAAQQGWLSQDLKVYETDVSIDGTHDFLKTGMSAKVTILIDELHDVLVVPIQAVITVEGKKLCYRSTGRGSQKREVETGLFNDDFVEVKSGLAEGEKVLLNPPRPAQVEETGKEA